MFDDDVASKITVVSARRQAVYDDLGSLFSAANVWRAIRGSAADFPQRSDGTTADKVGEDISEYHCEQRFGECAVASYSGSGAYLICQDLQICLLVLIVVNDL